MNGMMAVAYGAVGYLVFLVAFLYAIAFVGNLPAPKTIDSGEPGAVAVALLVNTLLLGLFAAQHSVMARPAFKSWWTRLVPQPVERTTYVLFASLALLLLYWQWLPMPAVVWSVANPAGAAILQTIFWAGWALVLISTFLINHFELFGLRQVYARLRGRTLPAPEFKTPSIYKQVRHPLYLGFLLAFWADTGHDRGSPVVCSCHHGLHPDRHPARGAGPDRAVRRSIPALPRAGVDADPAARPAAPRG